MNKINSVGGIMIENPEKGYVQDERRIRSGNTLTSQGITLPVSLFDQYIKNAEK